ncbi:radical SAM protein, partial [Candidatus Omnitrophota bacterium]
CAGKYLVNFYKVWLEYGLQSIHEKSLALINRGHTFGDFLAAVRQTRKRTGIKICAHTILGLPGETKQDVLKTASELGRLRLEGVKIHPLHVIRGTQLEGLLRQGRYQPLDLAEYVSLVSAFLEYLWPDTVIQRLSADCPAGVLVAPLWVLEKARTLREIDRLLLAQAGFQGRLFKD